MKRRNFVKQGVTASAATIFSSILYPSYAQERKIKIGLIGCGWYGMVITKAAFKVGGVEAMAICDVDSEHLKKSADDLEKLQGKRPDTYESYTDLLEHKGLEAVFIGTPPHWHALQFIAACKKGLDIYCEKPLAYDVQESMAMVHAAKEAGNIVQIGFQRRQSEAFGKARELIEAGMAGNIYQIDAHIHYNPILQDHTIQSPPASLDWESWCGPAPKLPYRPNIGHMAWRLEKEYGNGHLVDWGIHHIDIIRHIMNLDMPSAFKSEGGLQVLKEKITTPDTLTATMMFDSVPVTWQHRLWGSGELNTQYNNGIIFYGDKATLFASDRKVVLMPAGKDQEQQVMDIPGKDMAVAHMADFLNAVRKRNQALISCPIEDAYHSTATVQLAMISYYTKTEVNWDKDGHSVTNNPEADKLLAREYRGQYQRPAIP
jgi:predicted dehydrogenase